MIQDAVIVEDTPNNANFDLPPGLPEFLVRQIGNRNIPDECTTHTDFFKLFFTDDLVDGIVRETNA